VNFNKIILVIGACGVGKTWIMKQLLKRDKSKTFKLGKFYFHETENYIVVGKYDNSTFEGSDKLSMSVITDLNKMISYIEKKNKIAVFEGDRFTNSRFIKEANPIILKINGDGSEGRKLRKSKQSDRHLKSIFTRVSNIQSHKDCKNSNECLMLIQEIIDENNRIKRSRT